MKRYDYSHEFGRMIEDGVGDYALSWDVDAELASRDQRIAALEATLGRVVCNYASLHSVHWAMDDLQPEEKLERDGEAAMLNSARALLKGAK